MSGTTLADTQHPEESNCTDQRWKWYLVEVEWVNPKRWWIYIYSFGIFVVYSWPGCLRAGWYEFRYVNMSWKRQFALLMLCIAGAVRRRCGMDPMHIPVFASWVGKTSMSLKNAPILLARPSFVFTSTTFGLFVGNGEYHIGKQCPVTGIQGTQSAWLRTFIKRRPKCTPEAGGTL